MARAKKATKKKPKARAAITRPQLTKQHALTAPPSPRAETPDDQFRSNRTPIHLSVSKLRKVVKTANKAATMVDPPSAANSRNGSPVLSSEIGFYDPTDTETVASYSATGPDDDMFVSTPKTRDRSLKSVGGTLEQRMTEKTGHYLEAWTRNTAPWAHGTTLMSAIMASWKRCEESIEANVPLTRVMERVVSPPNFPYTNVDSSLACSFRTKCAMCGLIFKRRQKSISLPCTS